jgi:hypothetical protein
MGMVRHATGRCFLHEIEALSRSSLPFFLFFTIRNKLTFALSDVYLKGINSKKI